jgi:DNA-binding SARP family transcriptional activator
VLAAGRGRAHHRAMRPRAIRLQLLRSAQLVRADGATLPLNANDAALLALLAVDGATTRDRVIALLWSDEDDAARARNALRQRLFRLRRAAGADVVAGDEVLALAPLVQHDLGDPQAALAADPADALGGDLLGTQAYEGRIEFSLWLDAAREQWRSRRRDALAALASRLEGEDRIAPALVCAERLVRDEPLLEHAQRRLMRLHARRGDRGAALAAFERFRAALDDALGEVPSAETLALVRQIEEGGQLPVAHAPPPLSMLRPPRLVGRAQEWARIDAARRDGRVVAVVGEPGIGKTRLLADAAAAHGALLVGARPGDARVPYALAARLVQALSAHASDWAPEAWERTELARLAPELGPAPDGRVDAGRLQQAIARAVSRPGGGVALDDLQFADDATLELLPAIVAPQGAWLLAWRAHEAPAVLGQWADAVDAAECDTLRLGPLDERFVVELLDSLALPGIDGRSLGPRVHRHAGGNPFHTLETVRAWLAQPGAQDVAEGAPLPTTQSMRRLVEQRLRRLSVPALKLARVAAVAGADFDVDLAAAVLEVHALDLHDAWHELEAAHVLDGHRFAHDLVFDVARDSVPAALRRWVHARTAAHLEARGQAPPARVALHWRAAGEPARAAPVFERAAAAAAALGRLAEQCDWLDAAVEMHGAAGSPSARFEALERLAIAAREARSPARALEIAGTLLAAAGDGRERARALLQIGQCQLNAARFDLAQPQLEAAVDAAAEAGDTDTAQHARYLRALALAQLQGPAVALALIEPLAAWAEAQGDASLRHSFLADHAILCDQADQRRRARPMFERAIRHFDQARETGNAAPTRMMFARSLMCLGELPAACTLLEAAVRGRHELSAGEGGDGIEVLNLGRVYCELGRYADALQLLEPSAARLAERGSAVIQAATAVVMARVHAHLGQAARALALLNALPAELPFHVRAGAAWVHALLAAERPAERARRLDEALAQFGAGTDLPFARLPVQFDRLACTPPDDAAERLRAGVAECERRELAGPQMLGRMRLVEVLTRVGDARTALVVARDLVADLARVAPVGTYLPELYASCRAAAVAAGDRRFAQRCLDKAVAWIDEVARAQVPVPFRESFAQRNPVNRALLAAASLQPRSGS